MRIPFAVLVAAIMLSACKTLGPEPISVPPLTVGAGEGAASFKLCREGDVPDRDFRVDVDKVDDRFDKPMISPARGEGRAQSVSYQNATFLSDGRACHMWQFTAAPGTYVVTALQERYRPGPAIDVIGLMTQTVIAASKKTDTVRFSDEFGHLKDNAPTFRIRDGEVSKLGTITFKGYFVHFQVPVRDKTGYWDGQTTDIVQEPRLTVVYEAPAPDEPENGAPIVGNVTGATNQTLTPLLGREIVLEEPVQPALPGKS